MEIPASFYGRYHATNANSRKIIARLERGDDWQRAVGDELLDTRETAGLLVLNGPSPLLSGDAHFHCFLPWTRVKEAIAEGRLAPADETSVFETSLRTAWGLLGLMAPANVMWLYPQERHRPFLRAALRFWDEVNSTGARYTVGMERGDALWNLHTNLKYVLANSGVPPPVLKSALPVGGLPALIGGLDKSALDA